MKNKIPFSFVLDMLFPLNPAVRPMFGCHAVYAGEKIVMVLRNRSDHPNDNGVWLATSHEHHESLEKEIPGLRTIQLLNEGKGETGWRLIPANEDNFEAAVNFACGLILKGDPRIGKIPQRRKYKAAGKGGKKHIIK